MKAVHWLAALVALGGCDVVHTFHGGPQVQGSGNVVSENRDVSSFSSLVSAGSADCRISVGSGPSVTITGDDNILPLIETRVDNNCLFIESKGSYSTQSPLKVIIQVPSLESFVTRGSGDAEISGVTGKSFSAEIAGSGSIKADGQTDKVALAICGSGELDFLELRAQDAEASILGSGDIQVYATGRLNASIHGSGSIFYSGDPVTVEKNVAGSGEINGNLALERDTHSQQFDPN